MDRRPADDSQRAQPSTTRAELGVLALILLTAAILRTFLHDSTLPQRSFERHDEIHYILRVAEFLQGDWKVGYFINPTFSMYVLYAATAVSGWVLVALGQFESFADFALEATLNPYWITLPGRVLSVLIGVASVWLMWCLGRRLFSPRAGLIAAAALALNRTHAERCLSAGNEPLMVLLCLAFFLVLLRYLEQPSVRRHLLAGLLLGLAVSSKYNAGVLAVPFGVASIFAWRASGFRASLWVGFPVVLFAFVLGSPWVVLNLDEFLADFSRQADYLHEGWVPIQAIHGTLSWGYYPERFGPLNNGLAYALLCGVGLLMALVRSVKSLERRAVLLTLSILPIYLVLGSGVFNSMRFLLPAIPFLLLLGAWVLDTALARLPRQAGSWLSVAIVLAILAPHGVATYREFQAEYGPEDARTEMLTWVHTNLIPGEQYLELSVGEDNFLWDNLRLERFRLKESKLGTEAERRRLREFREQSFNARSLTDLIQDSPDLESLREKVRAGGYSELIVVLNTKAFMNLRQLPVLSHNQAIIHCGYWDDLLVWINSHQSGVRFESSDGRVVLQRFTLSGD